MRYLLITLVFFTSSMVVSAQQKANTLTQEEIAAGWILLFDGATPFGWTSNMHTVVDKDMITVAGDKIISKTTTSWQNVEVQFEYHLKKTPKGDAYVSVYSGTDVLAGHPLQVGDGKWNTTRLVYEFDPATGSYMSHESTVYSKNSSSKGRVGPHKLKDGVSSLAQIGFSAYHGADLSIRNIKLRPLKLKSIFNGKDMTGWKKFEGDKKRAKSDFTVTKEGWLNVKNGPGDLQTVGKYGEFILQLECISNGKHLNSGIFFRCRDNEYQNGYEAQIRNEFKPEATQEYLIEEYDPRTNKLVGKKKEKYTAFDYGTGAIYRRMPARKQMSKDGEWFAMTIVAHGNHFATWVNGVQVCDWTDHRPPSDNARNGYRKEAGHISIQGHDPTTDLSFRNFRIAELAKAK